MSYETLKRRLAHHGGNYQVDRMVEDKLRGLKRSLKASYQSATAVLEDGREFRCLINPNKLSMEADDKMLSIPFEDVCLTNPEGGSEPIDVKCGSVIEWKENGTHWIVYSQYLQEIAYFRGLMRQCEDEALEIDGKRFWYYLKGPDEKGIDWQKTKNFIFNELNYTVEIYISNTTETKQFFHRFKKCKIQEKPFEVQAIDDMSTKGILTVYLKEDFTNEWEAAKSDDGAQPEAPVPAGTPHIDGPVEVYPYDIVEYKALNTTGGKWLLSNNRASIISGNDSSVQVEITTGKSGSVSLIYRVEGKSDIIHNIKILSL